MKQIGSSSYEGKILSSIGGVYDRIGQYLKALDFHQQALAIQKQIGDRSGESSTLNSIGGVYNRIGQYPKALDFCQQALAIQKQINLLKPSPKAQYSYPLLYSIN